MGIGVEDELGSSKPRQVSDVTISQRVPLSSGDFEEYAVCCGQFSLLRGDKSRMCQNINIGTLKRCNIGALLYFRLDDRLAVNDNQPGPKLFGTPCGFADGPWRDMGKLYAGDSENVPVRSGQGAVCGDFPDYSVEIANADMVSEGDSLIIPCLRSLDQFHW